MNESKKSTEKLVKIALLGAVSYILTMLQFPLPFVPTFLKIDLGDLPALIGALIYGPMYGILIEGIKNVLAFIFINSGTAGIGEIANFIIGSSFVVSAAIVYRNLKKENKVKPPIIPLIIGSITMIIVSSILNYFLLIPVYAKVFGGIDLIIQAGTDINKYIKNLPTFITFAIMPFNIVKAFMLSIVYLLIHKKLLALFR